MRWLTIEGRLESRSEAVDVELVLRSAVSWDVSDHEGGCSDGMDVIGDIVWFMNAVHDESKRQSTLLDERGS
jgi:hypothetical protein